MQETWVQSLGWEDPLEKEMATHSSIIAWEIPWTWEQATVHGVAKSGTQLSDFTFTLKNWESFLFFYFSLPNFLDLFPDPSLLATCVCVCVCVCVYVCV